MSGTGRWCFSRKIWAFLRYCSLVISREVFFVSKGHRKPETYRANLCDQHKFCASRSVLLRTKWTVTFILRTAVFHYGNQQGWYPRRSGGCSPMEWNIHFLWKNTSKISPVPAWSGLSDVRFHSRIPHQEGSQDCGRYGYWSLLFVSAHRCA